LRLQRFQIEFKKIVSNESSMSNLLFENRSLKNEKSLKTKKNFFCFKTMEPHVSIRKFFLNKKKIFFFLFFLNKKEYNLIKMRKEFKCLGYWIKLKKKSINQNILLHKKRGKKSLISFTYLQVAFKNKSEQRRALIELQLSTNKQMFLVFISFAFYFAKLL